MTTLEAQRIDKAIATIEDAPAEGAAVAGATEDSCQLVFARYEIKYLLDERQRARIEAVMSEHMSPDEWGPSTTRSIYFDTPSLLLARRSAEHPHYKEKVRVRSYAPASGDDLVFCELKKKCDGITYKRRCHTGYDRTLGLLAGTVEPEGQIERELAFAGVRYEGLAPAVFLSYEREAFYAIEDHEFRITFDRNIRFRTDRVSLADGVDGEALLPEGISCMEVKCAGAIPLWLVRVLSDEGLRKGHFSKYGAACQRIFAAASARSAA